VLSVANSLKLVETGRYVFSLYLQDDFWIVHGKRGLKYVTLLYLTICKSISYSTPCFLGLNGNNYRYYGSLSSTPVLFDNYEEITSKVINEKLISQKITITQADLDLIKSIPGVKFNLPLTNETSTAFRGLVGRFGSKYRKAGIYIFTHKVTGSKYVGSSNSLSRRLEQYFSPDHLFTCRHVNSGLLLPLIKKEGLASFTFIFLMFFFFKLYPFIKGYI